MIQKLLEPIEADTLLVVLELGQRELKQKQETEQNPDRQEDLATELCRLDRLHEQIRGAHGVLVITIDGETHEPAAD